MEELNLTVVEITKAECKRQGIPVSKLEKDLGHGNGWLNPKKIKTMKLDDVLAVAEYLHVSLDLLCGRMPRNLNVFEEEIIVFFRMLNSNGQKEALQRIKELTQLQCYTEEAREFLIPSVG